MDLLDFGNEADSSAIEAFFSGTLLTIFATDMVKVVVASRLKHYLKPRFLIMINHAVGILLVIFGIYLVVRTFLNF
jgi:threonine/homoserine/homoserine lactone efflux protein